MQLNNFIILIGLLLLQVVVSSEINFQKYRSKKYDQNNKQINETINTTETFNQTITKTVVQITTTTISSKSTNSSGNNAIGDIGNVVINGTTAYVKYNDGYTFAKGVTTTTQKIKTKNIAKTRTTMRKSNKTKTNNNYLAPNPTSVMTPKNSAGHGNSNPDNASGSSNDTMENKKENRSYNFSFLLIAGIASIGLVAVSSYRVLKRKSDSKMKDLDLTNEYQYSMSTSTLKYIDELNTATSNASTLNSNTLNNNNVKGYATNDYTTASASVLASILESNLYNRDSYSSYGGSGEINDSKIYPKKNSILFSESKYATDNYPIVVSDNNNKSQNINNNTNNNSFNSAGQVDNYDESNNNNNNNNNTENKRKSNSFKVQQDSTRFSVRYDENGSLKRKSYLSVTSMSSSNGSISRHRSSLDKAIIRHSFLNPNIKIVRVNSRTQQLFEATDNQPAIIETFPSLERDFVPAVPVPLEECKENTLHPHQIYQTGPYNNYANEGEFENYYAYTIEDKEYIIDPTTNRVLEIHDLTTDEYMIVEEELYLDFSGNSSEEDEEEVRDYVEEEEENNI